MSEKVRDSAKYVADKCKLWHLPSNGVIAKIALRDLYLLFGTKKFQILISRKRWELAQ